MDRRRHRPSSGILNKRDTPSCLRRLNKKSRKKMTLLPRKIYETVKEESVEDRAEANINCPLGADIKPVHYKSVLCESRLSCAQNSGTKAPSPAAPVYKTLSNRSSPGGHRNIQVTPIQEAFIGEKMTPGSNASCRMDMETTFNPDDEDDCSSSVSITPTSLPSPEIFRNEVFSSRDDLLGVHLLIQNSTLLDVSNAKTINMHHSPNLSNIDASTIIEAKKVETIQSKEPKPEIKTPAGLSESVTDRGLKRKSTPKLSYRKRIPIKKKVCFKRPLNDEPVKREHTPIAVHKASQLSSPTKIKNEAEFSTSGVTSFKISPLQMMPQRPMDNPEKARIFDFIDDEDRNAFFQKIRERCVKLQSCTFFPFKFVTNASSSVIKSKKNM